MIKKIYLIRRRWKLYDLEKNVVT